LVSIIISFSLSLCLASSTLIHLLNSFLDSFFSLHLYYKAYEKGSKDVQKIERKIKWEKVDKDLYSAKVQTDIDQLKSQIINNKLPLDDVLSKTSQVMKNAAN
jgi:hypothetical protein